MATPSTDPPFARPLLLAALLAAATTSACAGSAGDDDVDPPAESGPEPMLFVMDTLTFAKADEAGVSEGFDLDGATSTAGGETGCGVGDYVSPEGQEGIDNGLAAVLPALEATEAVAVYGLIQDAINTGALLILAELGGVEDPLDDPSVDLVILRGQGEPSIGTDGYLEWHQTLDRNPDVPESRADGVALVDGRVQAGGLAVSLPIEILNASFVIEVEDMSIRLDLLDDGSALGVFGGPVSREAILGIASTENVDSAIVTLVEGLLDLAADIDADGDGYCEAISTNFLFTAVPAFLFDD